MLTGALNKMREERARFARDIEELRQMYMEDSIDDREVEMDFTYGAADDPDELKAAADILDKIPEEDDFTDREINTILNSDHDLSFDELVCGPNGCDDEACSEKCGSECGGSCGTESGDKCSGGCGCGKSRLLG